MKKLFLILIILGSVQVFNVSFAQISPIIPCTKLSQAAAFSKNDSAIEQQLEKLVKVGIPGVAMTINYGNGNINFAKGYAKIEDLSPMESCHLHYLQSIAKTYMAVAIMKLHEEGKIELDKAITAYLPPEIHQKISDAEKITVKMLLNHTSGIPEYNSQPRYLTKLLQQPTYVFDPKEYLHYIQNKILNFAPGSRYSYRNTNYLILALIGDYITGDHAKYIEDQIFKVLDLQSTYYKIQQGNSYNNRLANSYWDRHSDGIIENASVLQNTNVASMIGDDGLISTSEEAVIFLKGLMEGKLLSASSLEQMQEWVKNIKEEPAYGLGLSYTKFAGKLGIGHSGGGLGSGSQLFYFPEKKIYVFIVINLGTVTESPLHAEAEKILENLYEILL